MCLTIKINQKLQIAEEDIVIYKSVIMDLATLQLYSSYQGVLYTLNKLYKNRIYIETDSLNIKIGIHSFTHKKDAIKEADYWNNEFKNPSTANKNFANSKEIVIECIIPKNSEYIIGTFGMKNIPSIVSNQIILKKIL